MAAKDQAGEWIDAATAAQRLAVKPATLYAYVSRGVLRRRRDTDGRRSLFNVAEIEELARRGKPRRPPNPTELLIKSKITALGKDRPYYRGRDSLELADSCDFETIAMFLWTGELAETGRVNPWRPPADPSLSQADGPEPGRGARAGRPHRPVPQWVPDPVPDPDPDPRRWRAGREALHAAVAAQSGLPEDALPLDRLQVITTALGVADPLRFQLDSESVIDTARTLIAGLVDALPSAGQSAAGSVGQPAAGSVGESAGSVAARLWGRLCPQPAEPGLLRALEAALVLLADHELAASTLAARVAASVRADPYAVVASGLGVLSGPLHGGASYGAERLISEVSEPAQAARVVGDRLRRGERIPGLGHTVYKAGDQRGIHLLALLREAAPAHERLPVAQAILDEARRRRLPEPNIDFALATLAATSGMVPGAGEAIFAIARTAGWLAHALEEYERNTPLRPRALYTGPPLPT